jgi:hypothetical protein
MSLENQTDICTCGHSRAAHFEKDATACMNGDCLCLGFRKREPLLDAAPEMLAVLSDVAAMLPVAARLHPDDLLKLQTRVVAAIRKAKGN